MFTVLTFCAVVNAALKGRSLLYSNSKVVHCYHRLLLIRLKQQQQQQGRSSSSLSSTFVLSPPLPLLLLLLLLLSLLLLQKLTPKLLRVVLLLRHCIIYVDVIMANGLAFTKKYLFCGTNFSKKRGKLTFSDSKMAKKKNNT